jgi:hypothetical protein
VLNRKRRIKEILVRDFGLVVIRVGISLILLRGGVERKWSRSWGLLVSLKPGGAGAPRSVKLVRVF